MFFDDRHVDARMRGLIPRFARLGSFLTIVTAPLVADGTRLAFLLGNAAVALAVTFGVAGLLDRATDRQLQILLLLYGGLIANGTGLAGASGGPYVLMQALPVLFAAVFFRDQARYWVAVGLAVEHALVMRAYGDDRIGYDLVVFGLCMLVAHFGAQVADVLRDTLAANRALHSVLEVTSAAPDTRSLPDIGLAAALSVVGWDAGAVIIREGDLLAVAAASGVSDDVRRAYDEHPMRVDGPEMCPRIMRSGEPMYVSDVAAFLGADHPLVRDGVTCMIGVPIPYHGEHIGVLVMDHRTPRSPDEREWDRLTQVAEQLGLALGNMRAHQREAQVSAELRELNRRKDAFLATVSHELRTPATTISLAARTLRDADGRLDPGDRSYAHELLVRRSDELTGMIESLLDEATAESQAMRLQLATVDWCADLARWVETARAQTQREIVLLLPDPPVMSTGDPAKLERVVANLLSNAAKFSAPGTPISCRLLRDDDVVVVEVADRGRGIARADHDRIFERFWQADADSTRDVGGFGIGLSLVRRFVQAHGGTVGVRSVPGAGATFTVRLPRAVVPAQMPAAEAVQV